MGLIAKLKAAVIAVGAIGSLSGILTVLKWVPGVGPVAGIASAALGAFTAAFSLVWRGIVGVFANPATLAVVGLVSMFTFAYGVRLGGDEGSRRVAALQQEKDKAHADGEARLKAALAAREAAEREEAERRAADVPAVAPRPKPAPNRGGPERVRPKSADADHSGFCLPGLPSIWPKC